MLQPCLPWAKQLLMHMERLHLAEFEEIVLLTVAILHGDAYGVAIKAEIEQRLTRKVSVGALQTSLRRLEQKGFLESQLGEATKVRGGKRKRYFTVTQLGKKAMSHTMDMRQRLWAAIPKIALEP